MYCVGKGGFGKVWKVEKKKTKQLYAMKEMSKARILTKRSIKSVMNERQILTSLNNPFLVNMYYAFQDRENLYLVMDLLSGGDLRYHICKHRRFTEEQTIAGLEYFHNKNIIHRDIKPENLVLDEEGYVRITDFGIARVWRQDNAEDTSGTPGYMAPEVMCRQNHGIQVDYFAVGVMAFECMFGRRPYVGRSRKEIRDHILSKQVQIKRQDIPKGWSIEAADFINKMIQRKPVQRLGINGPAEVKNHPWLKDFSWQELWDRKIKAPFIPPKEDNFDQKNINEEWKDQEDEQFKANALMLRRNSVQALFNGYYFDYQLAALAAHPSLLNTQETGYAQKGGKPPLPGPIIQYPRSEQVSPKNFEMQKLALKQAAVEDPQIQKSQLRQTIDFKASQTFQNRKGSASMAVAQHYQQQQILEKEFQELKQKQQESFGQYSTQSYQIQQNAGKPDLISTSSTQNAKRPISRTGTSSTKNTTQNNNTSSCSKYQSSTVLHSRKGSFIAPSTNLQKEVGTHIRKGSSGLYESKYHNTRKIESQQQQLRR